MAARLTGLKRAWLFGLLAALISCACHDASAPRPFPEVRPLTATMVSAGTLTLPNRATSVKFAVIGDSGRGTRQQREVADQMAAFREQFPFAFVLMLGDNIYEGPATRVDYQQKFEHPYSKLLDDGVRFYAVLGNHDDPEQVNYPPFNMRGERYYSFAPPEDLLARIVTRVEFFAIDSTSLDRTQLQWLEERLAVSKADWKVCFLHHPLYTSGRYRSSSRLQRLILEPLLVRHDVDVAFSGHEHIYQRSVLQQGIQYFVSGAAGSLRPGDGAPSSNIARTFDGDYHFMLIEIDGGELHFQAVSRTGRTIDGGTLYQDGHDASESESTAATPQDTKVRR